MKDGEVKPAMTWTPDRIAGFLALRRPPKWRLLVTDDADWLEGHPGGFGSCDPASVGENFRVSALRLAEWLDGYTDGDVEEVLSAIVTWWEWSAFEQTKLMPEETLVPGFEQAHPLAAATLRRWAEAHATAFEQVARY